MSKKNPTIGRVRSNPVVSTPEGRVGKRQRAVEALANNAAPAITELADLVQQLRTDFDEHVHQASKETEVSYHEIQRLWRRVQHLERRLRQYVYAPTRPDSKHAPAATTSLFTFLGRPIVSSVG
jgi:hypothetical protein